MICRSICAARGVLFLVGADLDLAQRVGADGVHWPSWSTPIPLPQMMIASAACHEEAALNRAAARGVQIAFLSPVFETMSHPGQRALGAARFKAFAATSPLPVLALGGVDETNAGALAGPGVAGLGAIGAFLPC